MRKQRAFGLSPLGMNLVMLAALASSMGAQPWSGVLSPSRAINWSMAGVTGGIPTNRTQCGSTIAAYSGAPTTINSAISACGANQFVQLGAGTFNLSGGILFNSHSNVTLRGMGANQTFLVFSANNSCQGLYADICVQSSDVNWKNGPSNGPVNWTAGYAKGATSITLASVPNLKVGNPIILDQADDSTDNGGILVCSQESGSPVCSLQDNLGGGQRAGRNQVQIVTVTACGGVTTQGAACSGTNVSVTISPGLYMPNWNASTAAGGSNPQAWWATNPIAGVGIENLSIDNTGSGPPTMGVGFFNASNSWVKGIRDINSGRAHVQAQYSSHITVRDSYFFLTMNSIDQSYGFECYTSSDDLIENNIYQAVSGPLTVNGSCSGTVLGFNFDVNNYYTGSAGYINAMSNVHTAGTDNVLYEGNVGPQIYGDNFHGTHNLITGFRNYISGNLPACWVSGSTYASSTFGACNNDQEPIVMLSYSRFFNFIGNVLGQTGIQRTYEAYAGGTGTYPAIFHMGFGAAADGVTVANDPSTRSTLLRWGNYDTVNAANRFVTSELPTALTGLLSSLSNLIPASNTLPSSFYYTSAPSWWPSGKAWPPIGPDVSGGNVSGVGGHVFTIPAQDCYLNTMSGASNGSGGPYTFNPGACYTSSGSSGSGSGSTPPPTLMPPSSVVVTSN